MARPVSLSRIGLKLQISPTDPRSHLAPSLRVTSFEFMVSFTDPETRVFQAVDGEDLVILVCTIFD